jgi:hypothetical protein
MSLLGIVATVFGTVSQPTEMPEKTKDDWMNIDYDFYQRMQFPSCMGAVHGKHI